ncbi:hypothetical protein NE686_17115 [Tissierella carlieri]|uniref:Uncharacterized protein n=1 Tax=Tissierella carlieri TaxID=689904 RepID=A0ABT1SEW2_9FIRM|nr:hypothetical protein [Tissierella carlieri]MCQ4924825.1 hypothetical protein [Tissierella carlieri]
MLVSNLIITKKEEVVLKTIARTGFFLDPYRHESNVSDKVIRNCVKKELIKKENPPVMVFTKLLSPYTLTDKGMAIVRYKYMISLYKENLRHIEHDYVLGKIYLTLSEEEQETWRTESDLLLEYPSTSVIDGTYIDKQDKRVGVEVITSSYSEHDIDLKMKFIHKHCDRAIILNTKDIFKGGIA